MSGGHASQTWGFHDSVQVSTHVGKQFQSQGLYATLGRSSSTLKDETLFKDDALNNQGVLDNAQLLDHEQLDHEQLSQLSLDNYVKDEGEPDWSSFTNFDSEDMLADTPSGF
jgi:hypothetical protein